MAAINAAGILIDVFSWTTNDALNAQGKLDWVPSLPAEWGDQSVRVKIDFGYKFASIDKALVNLTGLRSIEVAPARERRNSPLGGFEVKIYANDLQLDHCFVTVSALTGADIAVADGTVMVIGR